MPHFDYTAIQADGTRVTGMVEAWSLQAAREALREMHLIVEELTEASPIPPLTPEHADELLGAGSAGSTQNGQSTTNNQQQTIQPSSESPIPNPQSLPTYFPLLDTLRLYAGWLLAWYCLVYALGSYQHFRPLPFTVPYVEGLFLSPLVLSFTLAAYLFLLLTGIWKAIGKGLLSGCALTIIGIAVFALYRMNVA
jgi:hypothetical protein